MENKSISRTLRLLSQLMELYDENSFKVRSVANAAFKVDKLPYPIAKKQLAEMELIEGIGKSTAAKIWELVQNKNISELNLLIEKTPPGIIEIMTIKGIGPKKVKTIWKELEIENIGELLYACNENRLIEAKGFGLKTQEEIKKAIEFKLASDGCFIYAHIEEFAEKLLQILKDISKIDLVSYTGDFRRRCEIVNNLDFLIGASNTEIKHHIENDSGLNIRSSAENVIEAQADNLLKIKIRFCDPEEYAWQLILDTGSEEHVSQLQKRVTSYKAKSEEEIYRSAGLQYIAPELREGLNEIAQAEAGRLKKLIEFTDLKGCLHNHSTWSDGVNTIEEMALYCRDNLHLQYLGITDHSKSAFYANGLNENRILAQITEIEALNAKLAPFKIFKGIESDILYDGSLDYPDEILTQFDFIVASIHSVFKMNEEKATERIIKAVENPYTSILGHASGRLLLSRKGYPLNHEKIIDACAANQVIMEINANPLRLDLDWRWHQYAMEKGVLLSINPDAHRISGFYDMHYGTLIARKGGVSALNCLNCMNLSEISAVFANKKSALTA